MVNPFVKTRNDVFTMIFKFGTVLSREACVHYAIIHSISLVSNNSMIFIFVLRITAIATLISVYSQPYKIVNNIADTFNVFGATTFTLLEIVK